MEDREVQPLTKDEAAWLNKLQKLLNQCPSKRLGCYTIGDANLTIYDKLVFDEYRQSMSHRDQRDDVNIHDELGTILDTLQMPFQVDGVSG